MIGAYQHLWWQRFMAEFLRVCVIAVGKQKGHQWHHRSFYENDSAHFKQYKRIVLDDIVSTTIHLRFIESFYLTRGWDCPTAC